LNEIVQDPDAIGSMWTTVSARIRGASAELEDMGEETDEYVESTSKLRDLVKGIAGVDIMKNGDKYADSSLNADEFHSGGYNGGGFSKTYT
jgi:hypothetical protein